MDYGNNNACHYNCFNGKFAMSNLDNGDLPKKFDGHSVEKLHKVIDRKIKILEDSNKLQAMTLGDYKIEFKDMLNPTKLREWFEKDSGRK